MPPRFRRAAVTCTSPRPGGAPFRIDARADGGGATAAAAARRLLSSAQSVRATGAAAAAPAGSPPTPRDPEGRRRTSGRQILQPANIGPSARKHMPSRARMSGENLRPPNICSSLPADRTQTAGTRLD